MNTTSFAAQALRVSSAQQARSHRTPTRAHATAPAPGDVGAYSSQFLPVFTPEMPEIVGQYVKLTVYYDI